MLINFFFFNIQLYESKELTVKLCKYIHISISGAQMNNFLNENWSEVIREFGPAVGDAFNHVFRQLVQNGFDMVPFDGFFPE